MNHAFVADAGVPMIFLQWPLMLGALVPVIIVEAVVLRRRLAVPNRQALEGAAIANIVSTAIGVPVAWAAMLLLELAITLPLASAGQSWDWLVSSPLAYVVNVIGIAWTGPPMRSYAFIAYAATMLLIPTLFVSVWLERRVLRRFYSGLDRAQIDRSVWLANLCSYAILLVGGCGWWGWEVCWGGETAPVAQRMYRDPVDLMYLHNAAIHGCNAASREKFITATRQLELGLADLQKMMHDVETGKIAVWKNLNRGAWESDRQTRESWTSVDYYGRTGIIRSVQRHRRAGSPSLIYIFDFSESGYMTRARIPGSDFDFAEQGRLEHWHSGKADCWSNP